MRWRKVGRSQNVEDRRGKGGGRMGPGMKVGGGGLLTILVILAGIFFQVDLSGLLGGGNAGLTSGGQTQTRNMPANDDASQFVSAILKTTEDVWTPLFAQAGKQYRPPKLILFEDGVRSACGFTSSAAGPFYCPGDYQAYIDLDFFGELQRMGAGGDFAGAYVLAHEVGHHVQNLLGVSMSVQQRQRQVGKTQANDLSVRAELQADCYAGVWAHHAHKQMQLLEPGDLEEGMNAAAKIGDDALMRNAGRRVRPESFTHGSSKQRQQWLLRGLETGDPNKCDTFN
ncbi:MAG: neutral zinc metallopeptidase [Granulosicoccus sp.]|nr:neutral zinc metallopeptidase [Granulosicoccus sp.]